MSLNQKTEVESTRGLTSKNKPALTIGVTAYYKSDPDKLKKLLYSFIVKQEDYWPLTSESMANPRKHNEAVAGFVERMSHIDKFTNDDYISFSTPVELIVVIDSYKTEDMNPENEGKLMNLKTIVTQFMQKIQELKLPLDIKIVIPNTNIKVSRARNYLIDHASSKFLTFKDDDDLSANINMLLEHTKSNFPVQIFYMVSGRYKTRIIDPDKSYPFISQLGCCAMIFEVDFLRRHKIYFVPDLGSEDVLFRGMLHRVIEKTEGSYHTINKVLYYYMDASNRSFTYSLSPREDIDLDGILQNQTLAQLEENQTATVIKILNTMPITEMTDYILFGISNVATFQRSLNIIRRAMQKKKSQFQSPLDKSLLYLTNQIVTPNNQNLFNLLEPRHQQQLLNLLPTYLTFSELKEAADDKFTLNPIVIRYMMMCYLINPNYNYPIDKGLTKKIYTTFCRNYGKRQFTQDFIMFAHERIKNSSCRSNLLDYINSNQPPTLNPEIKKLHPQIKDLYTEFLQMMKMKNEKILDSPNRNFRGMLNVFTFYMFTT